MSVEHHPALAHHFDDLDQQKESLTLGMWIFLATEVMVFGGLFVGYTVYRIIYPLAFAEGSSHLIWQLAGINTAVLIGSSFTMVLAVYGAQIGSPKMTAICIGLTILLGSTFLGIKAQEYAIDYHDGLVPIEGMFKTTGWTGASAAGVSEATYVARVKMFYVIYYIMTGVHATHMVLGIGVMLVFMVQAWRGRFTPDYHPQVELMGLYWHFVDVIWIFLLPLLYLIGTHH